MNFYKATKLRQRQYPLAKETSTSTSNDTQEIGENFLRGYISLKLILGLPPATIRLSIFKTKFC